MTAKTEFNYDLSTCASRAAMIKNEESTVLCGKDSSGVNVMIVTIQNRGMEMVAYQNNGWIRKQEYNADGELIDETFKRELIQ